MNDIKRCYEILGLKPNASREEVKEAYRNLAKIWHPDRFPTDPQLKQKAETEIKKINKAYQQLKSYQPIDQPSSQNSTETRIHPSLSNAETHYNQGVENTKRGRYQEAIEDFTKAIRINPSYVKAHEYRGLACSELGYENRASSDLAKAAELKWQQRKKDPQRTPPTSRSQSRSSTPPPKTSPWRFISTLSRHSDLIASIAISSDGEILTSGSRDKSIKVWHLDTGQLLPIQMGHSDSVNCIDIGPDGQILASGSSDKTIKLWHLGMGQLKHLLKGHTKLVSSVAFSPDGKVLASGSYDKTIKLWQLNIGREILTLRGHSDLVTSIAISQDGKMLASGSYDKTIKLWQLDTGKEICTLRGHSNLVSSVALSPDREILASGSSDGTIKLWRLDTGKELCMLRECLYWVHSVTFSPDGKTIAGASQNGTTVIWQLKEEKL